LSFQSLIYEVPRRAQEQSVMYLFSLDFSIAKQKSTIGSISARLWFK